jgi:hypothetical protein
LIGVISGQGRNELKGECNKTDNVVAKKKINWISEAIDVYKTNDEPARFSRVLYFNEVTKEDKIRINDKLKLLERYLKSGWKDGYISGSCVTAGDQLMAFKESCPF